MNKFFKDIIDLFPKKKTPSRDSFAIDSRLRSIISALPGGRSSKSLAEQLSQSIDHTGLPVPNANVYAYLEHAALYNPDISMASYSLTRLAQTSISLENVDGEALSPRSLDLIEELDARIEPFYGGLDGLSLNLLKSYATFGAAAAEAVLFESPYGQGVRRPYIMNPKNIRFKRNELNDWTPYQLLMNGQLIELSPLTFLYTPGELWVLEKPYGKPPAIAAIESLLRQAQILQNEDAILKLLGLMGFLSLAVEPPPKEMFPNATFEEYQTQVRLYLEKQAAAIANHEPGGTLVHVNTDEAKMVTTAGAAVGGTVEATWKNNKLQVAAGSSTPPAMLGNPISTTKGFNEVMYRLYVSQANTAQRIAAMFIGKMYTLNNLFNSNPERVIARYAAPEALDPYVLAQGYEIYQNMIYQRLLAGTIDDDTAAQELGELLDKGYQKAMVEKTQEPVPPPPTDDDEGDKENEDEDDLRVADERKNESTIPREDVYRSLTIHHVHSMELSLNTFTSDLTIPPLVRKTIKSYLNRIEDLANVGLHYSDNAINNFLIGSNFADFTNGDDFARQLGDIIAVEWGRLDNSWRSPVEESLSTIFSTFVLADTSGFSVAPDIAFSLGTPDLRAIEFMSQLDNQLWSSLWREGQSSNNQMQTWLSDRFLRDGEGIFGRIDDATRLSFRDAFGRRFGEIADFQINRIISTGVERSRSWARYSQYHQAGVRQLIRHTQEDTTDFCLLFKGDVIDTEPIYERTQSYLAMSPDQYLDTLREESQDLRRTNRIQDENDADYNARMDSLRTEMNASGTNNLPLHPNCLCYDEAVIVGVG